MQAQLAKVTHAVLVILLVALASNVAWRIIEPLLPVLLTLGILSWVFTRLLGKQ